jgi:hypothetical protein
MKEAQKATEEIDRRVEINQQGNEVSMSEL